MVSPSAAVSGTSDFLLLVCEHKPEGSNQPNLNAWLVPLSSSVQEMGLGGGVAAAPISMSYNNNFYNPALPGRHAYSLQDLVYLFCKGHRVLVERP